MFGKLIILMVSNFHQTSSSSKNSQTISTIWSSGHDYDAIIGEQQEGQTFCITRNCYKHHARTAEVSLVNPVFEELALLPLSQILLRLPKPKRTSYLCKACQTGFLAFIAIAIILDQACTRHFHLFWLQIVSTRRISPVFSCHFLQICKHGQMIMIKCG